jgi:predicted TPR repeat methyltransferase
VTEAQITSALSLADSAQQSGMFSDAESVCREILTDHPNHPQVLRILGIICRKTSRLDEALVHLEASIRADPRDPLAHRDHADALRAAKKFDESIASYRGAIQLRPDWPEIHGALGNALKDANQLDAAIDAYQAALRLSPHLAMAHLRLGETLHEANRLPEAHAAIARALEFVPEWAEAFNSLGNLLWDEQKLDEAIAAYQRARQLQPGFPRANWSLGKLLAKRGQTELALRAFQTVVDAHPSNAQAHFNLARMRRLAGQTQPACDAYRRAIELSPDRADWKFELAACAQDGSVQTIPDNYIRELFDDYSDTFDEHLVGILHYHVPEMFLAALAKIAPNKKFARVLDLGCGTGLCGQAVRPIARQLTGVDLSPKMIRKAQSRNVYDHLIQADLLSALKHPNSFDLILAGDVLIYVGDLTNLMPAIATTLQPGGLFIFSVEHFDGPGFSLHKAERFAHSLPYIRQSAQANGLREIFAEKVELRRQTDKPTPGWIVVLGK